MGWKLNGKPLRAVVFDLDGTLADTIRDLAASVNEGIRPFRETLQPVDRIRDFVGEGIETTVTRALDGDDTNLEQALARFREHYLEHFNDTTEMYPGVKEFMQSTPGLIKCVISNKMQEMTDEVVTQLSLREHVDPVIGARDPWTPKPEPDVLLELIEAWKVKPDEVLVVGDNWTDLQFAENAGARAVYCKYGYGRPGDSPRLAEVSSFSEFASLVEPQN